MSFLVLGTSARGGKFILLTKACLMWDVRGRSEEACEFSLCAFLGSMIIRSWWEGRDAGVEVLGARCPQTGVLWSRGPGVFDSCAEDSLQDSLSICYVEHFYRTLPL